MKLSAYNTSKALTLTLAGRKVRKHLNADSLLAAIRQDFQKIPDSRGANSKITLDDALMSALAMFQLKDQSLLAFDKRRSEEDHNLRSVYGLSNIPCDSQMRTILDPLPLSALRAPFLSVFRQIQRGKDFEKMAYYDGHYLLSGDGTGFYSSEKVSSPYCMGKKSRNGKILYHQQMYAACFVKPGSKVVIPVFPEMITQNDGTSKNDCERNAAKRFFKDFRREHPHLKVIVVEDALSSNGPHIKELKNHDLRFILGAKPKDHKALFKELDRATNEGRASEIQFLDPEDQKTGHIFKYLNNVLLNQSHPDLLVNVLEYYQVNKKGKVTEFSWVTDIEITDDNVYQLMRAGRARWKIENETFNTLKNQGYNLGHNYGLGKKNLSGIFTILMMLAFLVDQAQQLSCWLFQAALIKGRIKRTLWELIRSTIQLFEVDSMERVLRIIVFGSKEAFKT
ncbi:transposase [Desulfogranum marinum]|uniref:transposase n=1 Tax=Desulfogranum marinum TaxID=453220 RepID=UPI001965D154|nr:transposase [Desulfogranum marinum]MBM9514027.1 transposase [Desulfogranum marinum]